MSEINRDDLNEIARRTANIENSFNTLGYNSNALGLKPGEEYITADGEKYTILDEFDFAKSDSDAYQKAVVLKDENGNVFFHFNGTGDGNWLYNAAAYGVDQPSDMQVACAEWFDETYEKLANEGVISDGNVYVTGHSQGGNNAMYVTMCSEYAGNIDACVPLDGPGFSNNFVNERKGVLGDEYYERTDKIWPYNGENDYVSVLGQTSVVPDDGRIVYVKYSKEVHDFEHYHAATGMVDENGQFTGLIYDQNGDSDFRKMIKSFVGKVSDLSQDEQAIVASMMMKICENYIGNPDIEFRGEYFTPEEFALAKEVLLPVLVDFLAEDHEGLNQIICNLTGFDSGTVDAIIGVINIINTLPEKDRTVFYESILDLVVVENNQITLDFSKIDDLLSTLKEVVEKNYINDPLKLAELFGEIGIEWEPLQLVAAVGVIVVYRFLEDKFEEIEPLIQGVLALLEAYPQIGEFAGKFFEAVVNAVSAVKKWINENLNKGYQYAQNNPWFRADTDKLRGYADRLNRVNNRLSNLDRQMQSLYLQVGLLDLWDILCANLITCESYSLNRAKTYLYNTANRLETADNKANNYMGG